MAPAGLELVLLALAVLADTAVGLGLFVPAELSLLLIGDATSDDLAHPVPFVAAVAVTAALAVVGSLIGFRLGRRWSPPPRALRALDRLGPEWSASLSRFVPVVRPAAGFVLGGTGMSAREFARWTVPATLLWVPVVMVAGRVLGDVIAVDPDVDRVVRLCLALPLVAGVLAPLVERRRPGRGR